MAIPRSSGPDRHPPPTTTPGPSLSPTRSAAAFPVSSAPFDSRTHQTGFPLTSLLSGLEIRRNPERTVINVRGGVCRGGRAAWWGSRDQLFGTGPLLDAPAPGAGRQPALKARGSMIAPPTTAIGPHASPPTFAASPPQFVVRWRALHAIGSVRYAAHHYGGSRRLAPCSDHRHGSWPRTWCVQIWR